MMDMGKDSAKSYAVIGAIMLTLCCIALIFFSELPGVKLSVGSFAFASLVICGVGIYNLKNINIYEDEEKNKEKEREAAMALSLLPGLGHKYLTGKLKIIHTIVFTISLILIIAGILIISEIINIEEGVGWILLVYGLVIFFFSWSWSALEVNDICNNMNLQNINGIFSMSWNKTESGLSILFIVTFIILAGMSIAWGYFYPQYFYAAAIATLASALLLVWLIINKIRKNK